MSLRVPVVVFAVLVALCAVVLIVVLVDEPANSRGIDHPGFETMRQGGDSSRHDSVLLLGWLYGTLSIGLFVGLMAMALRRGGRLPAGSGPALLTGLALVVLVFTLLVLSYRSYVAPEAVRTLFGSFPQPTAWMLYGLWPVPLVFVLLYVRNFDRWVISEDEVAEFERLAAETRAGRASRGDADGAAGSPGES